MNNDTVQATPEYNLYELEKLRKAIDLLLHLEESEDEESLKLDDARDSVRRRIRGLAIDLNIHI